MNHHSLCSRWASALALVAALLLPVLTPRAAYAALDFRIESESVVVDPRTLTVVFTLTFNQVPDFSLVTGTDRQVQAFQYFIMGDASQPYPGKFDAIIRGGELYATGDQLRIRYAEPPDPDPMSGGWGAVRGTAPYQLNGQQLTFSVPLDLINDHSADGHFTYWAESYQDGRMTRSLTRQSIVATRTLVTDPFHRTVTNGWRTAEIGGAYTLAGNAALYAVNGRAGTMTLARGTGGAAFLPNVTAQQLDVRRRVATDKPAAGAQQYAYVAVRAVGTNTEYRAQLRFTPNRTVQVRLARAINNAETTLGTIRNVPGVRHVANGFIWLRMQAVGSNPTTLRIKAWAEGQAEPATWLVTATDATPVLQTAGTVGLRAFVPPATTNAPVRFSFDDFDVWETQP